MLFLNANQLEQIKKEQDFRVLRRFSEYLRRQHGNIVIRQATCSSYIKDMKIDDLDSLVENSVAVALKFGFTKESDLLVFTVLRFIICPNYHESDPVRSVFCNTSIPVEDKIDRLWRYTTESDWDLIANAYDKTAW